MWSRCWPLLAACRSSCFRFAAWKSSLMLDPNTACTTTKVGWYLHVCCPCKITTLSTIVQYFMPWPSVDNVWQLAYIGKVTLMEPDAEQAIANILSSATAALQCGDVSDYLTSVTVTFACIVCHERLIASSLQCRSLICHFKLSTDHSKNFDGCIVSCALNIL